MYRELELMNNVISTAVCRSKKKFNLKVLKKKWHNDKNVQLGRIAKSNRHLIFNFNILVLWPSANISLILVNPWLIMSVLNLNSDLPLAHQWSYEPGEPLAINVSSKFKLWPSLSPSCEPGEPLAIKVSSKFKLFV